MKIVKAMIGSLLLAALPLAAQADEMSYSYLEVAYVDADLDNVASGDGPSLRGSFGIAENFFVFADYTTLEFPASVDLDIINAGVGGRYGISDKVDLVGKIAYTELDLSVPGFGSDSVDGFAVSAGLRGQVTEDFELEGHVIHTDLGSDGGDSTGFAVGGRYFFTKNFAAGVEYRTDEIADEDFDILSVHARWAF